MSAHEYDNVDPSVEKYLEKGTLPNLDVDWLIGGKNVQNDVLHNDRSNEGHLETIGSSPKSEVGNTRGSENSRPAREENIPIRKVNSIPVKGTSYMHANGDTLRRSVTASKPMEEQKHHGFFSSLFRSSSKHRQEKERSMPPSLEMQTPTSHTTHSEHHSVSSATMSPSNHNEVHIESSANKMSFNETSESRYVHPRNKKLEEFIEYYKKNGFSVSAFKNQNYVDSQDSQDSDINKSHQDSPSKPNSAVDARGRQIPAHPKRSKFPPAIKLSSLRRLEDNSISEEELNRMQQQEHPAGTSISNSSRFGSFLSRVTSHGNAGAVGSSQSLASKQSNTALSNIESTRELQTSVAKQNRKKDTKLVVPGLEKVEPLKFVAFAQNTYFNDPPQQISSKNPRPGEVEVKPDGSVIIHRLTPEERREVSSSFSPGMVIGGTGRLHLLSEFEPPASDDNTQPETAIQGNNEQLDKHKQPNEVASHDEHTQVASKEASERAKVARNDSDNEDEGEVEISDMASKLKIDKQLVHAPASDAADYELKIEDVDDTPYPPNEDIPHDEVYTRCCHLREILPIPATMRQIKKGSTSPIPILKLHNPHPSMIEILTFSDFIRAVPIVSLSLDGVHLSVQMLRILLSSIIFNKSLIKLSMRNTPLDSEGWKLVCYFICNRKELKSVDLSMAPSIITSAQKLKHNVLKKSDTRMNYNPENRSELNWDLLTASIAKKGGLEEIIIAGAQMSLDQFENFIEVACMATERLGLAFNKLTKEQCDLLSKWLVQNNVTGLDVGFNDLRGKLSSFSDAIWNKIQNAGYQDALSYLSFNGTNLEVLDGATSNDNEVLKLITVLCYCENLQFLDLSNNPKIFPACSRTLIKCLPVFVDLVRLHLDYNNIQNTEIVMLTEILPLCSKLNYFSMLGSKLEVATYKLLMDAVRKSNSIITLNVDSQDFSEDLTNELSILTLRNLQDQFKTLNAVDEKNVPLPNLQEELAKILTKRGKDDPEFDKEVDDFINNLSNSRVTIIKVVNDLFNLQAKGQLNTEGKETLIRLCFTNDCLEKGIRLLKSKRGEHDINKHDLRGSNTDYSPTETMPALSSYLNLNKLNHYAPYQRELVREFDPSTEVSEQKTNLITATTSKVYSQTSEEGKIFKKSALLSTHVDHECHDLVDEELGANTKEPVNSDLIKDLILRNDISNSVDIIDELHKHGYHLHEIFKKSPVSEQGTLKHYISRERNGSNSDSTDPENKSDQKENPSNLNGEDQKAIDAAYDSVLDQFISKK
ncbi:hypothetical protein TPHA_0E02360 [Tetrapisispora phaffii CBS 4417]|uniref:Uncharacterized protein n=1 Tax=Tetrapisispora phaffii (strain ATCC 24235 / CBS 4417 / NBRC 1672 / NRRL Y-8282 / UCD 70-5) TaxID=1071381 RepID=G8BTV0_TETPH|nr:hypothetical protein TPHA_0E02360 [Tetrapisispora phaffii CBS 4417]CCE63328.1 hypothetical protein TPHA_0E02360 [Tetrapisispora phaffii CBS 4417]